MIVNLVSNKGKKQLQLLFPTHSFIELITNEYY